MHLPQTYETKAYISEAGFFCISQPSDRGGDEQIVVLSLDQLFELKKAIPGFLKSMRAPKEE